MKLSDIQLIAFPDHEGRLDFPVTIAREGYVITLCIMTRHGIHYPAAVMRPVVLLYYGDLIERVLDNEIILDAFEHYCKTICTVEEPYINEEVREKAEMLRMVLEIFFP